MRRRKRTDQYAEIKFLLFNFHHLLRVNLGRCEAVYTFLSVAAVFEQEGLFNSWKCYETVGSVKQQQEML